MKSCDKLQCHIVCCACRKLSILLFESWHPPVVHSSCTKHEQGPVLTITCKLIKEWLTIILSNRFCNNQGNQLCGHHTRNRTILWVETCNIKKETPTHDVKRMIVTWLNSLLLKIICRSLSLQFSVQLISVVRENYASFVTRISILFKVNSNANGRWRWRLLWSLVTWYVQIFCKKSNILENAQISFKVQNLSNFV